MATPDIPGAIPAVPLAEQDTQPMELDDGIGWHAWERIATKRDLRPVCTDDENL